MDTIKIPSEGINKEDVIKELRSLNSNDSNWRDGKTWSLVYHLGDEHTQFLKEAYGSYFSENGLNPIAFKSLKKMEHEVVRMTADMLNGAEHAVGTMTSGGTESILVAVKTYRDLFNKKRRKLLQMPKLREQQPEMIVSETAHIAFYKAAKYFDIKMRIVKVNKDKTMDVKGIKKQINKNTMLIVGSAPNYPNGMVDPIEDLGKIAHKKNIPLHVDACLGGFILPFVEKIGHQIPPFDFRVQGVTSISADVHKYGFAAKGASVILYRNMEFLKHQFYAESNWPGGIFISPAMLGTRPGGAIAAAWSALRHIGQNGYKEKAELIMNNTSKLRDGISSIDGLAIVGNPHACIFAYRSTEKNIDIFAVADQMEQKGWHVDRQQKPNSLHVMITPAHTKILDSYIEDLRTAVEYVKAHPELKNEGNAAMYGMMTKLPMRGLIEDELLSVMEGMYGVVPQEPDFENEEVDIKTQLAQKVVQIRNRIDNFLGKDE